MKSNLSSWYTKVNADVFLRVFRPSFQGEKDSSTNTPKNILYDRLCSMRFILKQNLQNNSKEQKTSPQN